MDTQPGGEGGRPDEFMVLLAEFGDGCIAADHGEDASIGVDERSDGFAADGREDVFCAVLAGLLGDGRELRQWFAVGAEGVGQVADGVDVVEASNGEVGLYFEPSVWVLRRGRLCANGLGFDAGGPDYHSGRDSRAVGEKNLVGSDFFDGCAEVELHTVLLERRGSVALRGRREVAKDRGAHFEEKDLRAVGVDVPEFFPKDSLQHVAEGSGHLDSSGASAYDDKVQQAGGYVTGVAIGCLEGLKNGGPQLFGVGEGVEREGELFCSGNSEEVHVGACRQDEKISGEAVAGGGVDGALLEVDEGDFIHLDIDVVVVAEHVAQRKRRVVGRQDAGCYLVEEGVELLVVVLVEECDVDVGVRGEFEGAAQAGEASSDDDDTP